jgi:hypothetical protein
VARPVAAALAALVLLAGCGGDDEGGGGGGAPEPRTAVEQATAFVDCFDQRGYRAVRPKPREESLFAFTAKRRGYAVAPVNVVKDGGLVASAFLAFFDSETKAKKAMDELATTSVGDVPPLQQGPAVVGYSDDEDKRAVEATLKRCVG